MLCRRPGVSRNPRGSTLPECYTVIRLAFPAPDDSPLGRSPLSVRYVIERGRNGDPLPVLRFDRGRRQLTRDAWQGYRQAGASITADSDREASIVRQVLGANAI